MSTCTITIYHNVETDSEGRHTALLDGYCAGDRLRRVFQANISRDGLGADDTESIAERVFEMGNVLDSGYYAHDPLHAHARTYRRDGLVRSVSVGDLIVVENEEGDPTFLAVESIGFRALALV